MICWTFKNSQEIWNKINFFHTKHPLTDICAALCNLMILSEFNNGSRDHTADFSDSNLWVLVMRTFSIFLELQSYSFGSKTAYFGDDTSFSNTGENFLIYYNITLSFFSWDGIHLKLRLVPCDDFTHQIIKLFFFLEFPHRKHKVVLLRCNSKSLLGWWRKSFSFFTQKYRLS